MKSMIITDITSNEKFIRFQKFQQATHFAVHVQNELSEECYFGEVFELSGNVGEKSPKTRTCISLQFTDRKPKSSVFARRFKRVR